MPRNIKDMTSEQLRRTFMETSYRVQFQKKVRWKDRNMLSTIEHELDRRHHR